MIVDIKKVENNLYRLNIPIYQRFEYTNEPNISLFNIFNNYNVNDIKLSEKNGYCIYILEYIEYIKQGKLYQYYNYKYGSKNIIYINSRIQ